MTLEDVAAYLSKEEWECPDPAWRGCGWDVLPESRGNVPISGVSVTLTSLREGGSFPQVDCGPLGISQTPAVSLLSTFRVSPSLTEVSPAVVGLQWPKESLGSMLN